MSEAINAFLLGFPALFSIVNPISGAFIFRSVTSGRTPEMRARLARLVALNALGVMMGALWAGSYVLAFFGITLAALRVAGGLVVALSGWGLLMPCAGNAVRRAVRARSWAVDLRSGARWDFSAEQLLDPPDALDEVVVAQRVRQPQVAARAERLTGHHGDLGLLEDQLGELGRRAAASGRAIVRPSTPLTDG